MSDGYALHGRVWRPTRRDPSRAVIYLHGIQSHGGWFEWSASLLAQYGGPVILPDRRGSGLNDVARGDTPSAQRWLEDIDELARWAEREFGVGGFELVGVSWGGKPALAWALRRADRVARLLLIGPGLFPAVDVGLRTRFQIGLSLLRGEKRTFPIPLDDPPLFTDNPEGQDFIANDPLKLTRATARFFWHSASLDRRLRRAATGALRAETTLVLAGADRIIRNPLTEAWILRVAGEKTRVVTLPDAGHTLEFAADRRPFRALMERWVSDGLQVAEEKRLATTGC
ncbi:MAG: alpha/beta hydrolase [Phycisphaerae bacterium]